METGAIVLTRWLIPVLLLLCTACTPMHSSIKPPYTLEGVPYTTQLVQRVAAERCQAIAPSTAKPPNAFTTDGCSLWPNGLWRSCCIEHDILYWCGGPNWRRRKADHLLHECVHRHSNALNANLMYIGVRIGGSRLLPLPWRWGYGYPWPYQEPVPTDSSTDLDQGICDRQKASWSPQACVESGTE